jgi:hypothetical protein
MDRNSRPNFAAISAEEERRRANEEADRGGSSGRGMGSFLERVAVVVRRRRL